MREKIEALAAKGSTPLYLILECSSYMQALEALRSGACAAVLPDLARPKEGPSLYQRIPVPGSIEISPIWRKRTAERNPRLALLTKSILKLWKIRAF
ncbi:MAG: hypothetical protein LAT55_12855 [Opitutales bacterium]|nr:hypothetical protein [Opitutales bacterium]